jgi:pyruvate dehydrogenase E2 component (dihydrolipoamide acetyltransferase)
MNTMGRWCRLVPALCIVNYPEVAILGIGQARRQRTADDGSGGEKRLRLPLSLSYDHHVINGAKLAEMLSNPSDFLIES